MDKIFLTKLSSSSESVSIESNKNGCNFEVFVLFLLIFGVCVLSLYEIDGSLDVSLDMDNKRVFVL